MPRKIQVKLSASSIDEAIKQLQEYKAKVQRKTDELCRRLAEMGAVRISLGYARAVYTGEKDISVSVEPRGNGYAIVANGESVMFVEFGAGITYGYGHPMDGELGMGPGTYPDGKGHWNDPSGWFLPRNEGGDHTFGNPPSMVMYRTARELEDAVLQVAREVFASD